MTLEDVVMYSRIIPPINTEEEGKASGSKLGSGLSFEDFSKLVKGDGLGGELSFEDFSKLVKGDGK